LREQCIVADGVKRFIEVVNRLLPGISYSIDIDSLL
jgi:hypothetical protein